MESEAEAGWQQRQLMEIESLSAIYFEDGDLKVDEEAPEALRNAVLEAKEDAAGAGMALSVRLHGSGHRLAAVLPQNYPGTAVPVVWLEPEMDPQAKLAELRLAEDDDLCGKVQDAARRLGEQGEECLLPLIQEAEELIRSCLDDIAVATAVAEDEEEEDPSFALQLAVPRPSASACQVLGRRAMFSHHIIAPSKRQAIKEWAAQLDLGGLAKVGWPGLIIVEGDERNVAAYVDALSRLRWKHFVVRAEQMIQVESFHLEKSRVLPMPLEEYPPDGMSEFSARCRALGVEELFLAALKLPGNSDKKSKGKKR